MPSQCSANPTYVHHTLELASPIPDHAPTTISALLHPSMIPRLPNPCAISPTSDKDHDFPYEVIKTEDRGYGMFARRDIERGELIKLEHPVFIVPALPLPGANGFEIYERVGSAIPKSEYEEMTTMANCRSPDECPSIIEGVARTNALTLDFLFPSADEQDPETKELFDRPLGKHFGGVFLKINRCNHSCGPNASYKWDFDTLSTRLFALRPISCGSEITINYTNLLQPRASRHVKLNADYRFSCDCPWCTFPDTLDQQKSDAARTFISTYLSTHPSYRKWSLDICLPDNFVIVSHLSAIPLILQEGLDALLPLFKEEIMRCYGELGNMELFRLYAEKVKEMVRVSDAELAKEVERYLEDPVCNFPKWGARLKLRQNQAKRRVVEEETEDLFMESLFGPSIIESVA